MQCIGEYLLDVRSIVLLEGPVAGEAPLLPTLRQYSTMAPGMAFGVTNRLTGSQITLAVLTKVTVVEAMT